eukprot:1328056-Amorphochlora_amoeboformis.AAC.1
MMTSGVSRTSALYALSDSIKLPPQPSGGKYCTIPPLGFEEGQLVLIVGLSGTCDCGGIGLSGGRSSRDF